MAEQEYSPQQALQVLVQRIQARDKSLAEQIRQAVNLGKDVVEAEGGRRRRRYRRTVRLSDDEALKAAVQVLQAHFVEQALFLASAAAEFKEAAVSTATESKRPDQHNEYRIGVGEPKEVHVEIQTDTQVIESGEETRPFATPEAESIRVQQENLGKLLELLSFHQEHRGGDVTGS